MKMEFTFVYFSGTFWNVKICEEIALRDLHNGVLREVSSCRGGNIFGTFIFTNLFATSLHFLEC